MFESVWLTVFSFEALLFTITIVLILIAMAKERSEYRHKTAALIDPLTGSATAARFIRTVKPNSSGRQLTGAPTAMMLFDLDNFKSINDHFGHAIGDRVLQLFAQVGSEQMRHSDIFGRLGGEKFAALLVDAPRERALAVAERDSLKLRRRSQRSRRKTGGRHRECRRFRQPQLFARSLGVAGSGRFRPLSRQRQRPELHRDCIDRVFSRSHPPQRRIKAIARFEYKDALAGSRRLATPHKRDRAVRSAPRHCSLCCLRHACDIPKEWEARTDGVRGR